MTATPTVVGMMKFRLTVPMEVRRQASSGPTPSNNSRIIPIGAVMRLK